MILCIAVLLQIYKIEHDNGKQRHRSLLSAFIKRPSQIPSIDLSLSVAPVGKAAGSLEGGDKAKRDNAFRLYQESLKQNLCLGYFHHFPLAESCSYALPNP